MTSYTVVKDCTALVITPEAAAAIEPMLRDALRRPGVVTRLEPLQLAELDRGDFLDHVREEVALSRDKQFALLTPVNTLHGAVTRMGEAMRRCGPSAPGTDPDVAINTARCAFKQACAEIAALAVRLGTEGSPAFPDTMPNGGRA